VCVEQFFLEGVELLVIQVEVDFQRAIGCSSSLSEESQDLGEHCVKVHHRPPTRASAASTCGNQRLMSMALYSSMAIDNSALACSR
jgi:hypothetical protein